MQKKNSLLSAHFCICPDGVSWKPYPSVICSMCGYPPVLRLNIDFYEEEQMSAFLKLMKVVDWEKIVREETT